MMILRMQLIIINITHDEGDEQEWSLNTVMTQVDRCDKRERDLGSLKMKINCWTKPKKLGLREIENKADDNKITLLY